MRRPPPVAAVPQSWAYPEAGALSVFEEYPLSFEVPFIGVERDLEALSTTTKLSLRVEEVEAMSCYVSHPRKDAETPGHCRSFHTRITFEVHFDHSSSKYATKKYSEFLIDRWPYPPIMVIIDR